jgi:hypothetical protein
VQERLRERVIGVAGRAEPCRKPEYPSESLTAS